MYDPQRTAGGDSQQPHLTSPTSWAAACEEKTTLLTPVHREPAVDPADLMEKHGPRPYAGGFPVPREPGFL